MIHQATSEGSLSRSIQPLRLNSDVRQLWALRALVPLRGWKWLLEEREIYASESLAKLVGLPALSDPDVDPSLSERRQHLIRSWRRAEAVARRYQLRHPFGTNMEALRGLLGLSATEAQILGFVICMAFDPVLNEIGENVGPVSQHGTRGWATMLGLPPDRIRKAFLPRGRIVTSRVLSSLGPVMHAATDLQVNSPELEAVYLHRGWRPEQLIAGFARSIPIAELSPRDFPHHADEIDLLVGYLRGAIARRRKGVNVLLHGMPGVGKTQLSRMIAQSVRAQAYEVAMADADGDPANGQRRLGMLASCQRVLADRRALLVFDEVDHALDDRGLLSDGQTTAERIKGWLNDQLESNPIPTVWIANRIRHLNPALARRFDIVMEVKVPPTAQRVAMIRAETGHLLDAAATRRLASVPSLSPATLRRAARVVQSVKGAPAQRAERLTRLIDRSLRAQHLSGLTHPEASRVALEFDPDLINSPVDLRILAEGLITHPHGRLCLYGPPGTGKTAFGQWLASRLDQPAIVKKASDLLGPYVGQTERQIADAFEEARDSQSLLQIDEVEGFLRSRGQAKARWEASLVNEFLVQMEAFPGIFIATTNLLGELDPAALRRFDTKINFTWLRPEQAERCLAELLLRLALPTEIPALAAEGLRRLTTVTPGDFAAVARRHRFQPFSGAYDVVAALEEESRLKQAGVPRRMGFV